MRPSKNAFLVFMVQKFYIVQHYLRIFFVKFGNIYTSLYSRSIHTVLFVFFTISILCKFNLFYCVASWKTSKSYANVHARPKCYCGHLSSMKYIFHDLILNFDKISLQNLLKCCIYKNMYLRQKFCFRKPPFIYEKFFLCL